MAHDKRIDGLADTRRNPDLIVELRHLILGMALVI